LLLLLMRLKDDNLFSFVELNGASGVRHEPNVLEESTTPSKRATRRRQGVIGC